VLRTSLKKAILDSGYGSDAEAILDSDHGSDADNREIIMIGRFDRANS
jgi:hypothetical protein